MLATAHSMLIGIVCFVASVIYCCQDQLLKQQSLHLTHYHCWNLPSAMQGSVSNWSCTL